MNATEFQDLEERAGTQNGVLSDEKGPEGAGRVFLRFGLIGIVADGVD